MAPLCNQEDNVYYNEEGDSSSSSSSSSSSLCSSIISTTTEQSSPIKNNPPATKRSVSFCAGAAVHLGAVMHIEDYSDAEKCDCWFQVQEMREIRKEVKDTIALMNRNIDCDDDSSINSSTSCSSNETQTETRGLEGKTRAGKRYRRETRIASLAAVFDEQTMQEMDGVTDDVMIAIAYSSYSYPMQVAAFQRASQYQKEQQQAEAEADAHNAHTNTTQSQSQQVTAMTSEAADCAADVHVRDYNNNNNKVYQVDDTLTTTTTKTTTDKNNISCDQQEEPVVVGPTKYDFNKSHSTQSFGNLLELEQQPEDVLFDDESSLAALTSLTSSMTKTSATNMRYETTDDSLNNQNIDVHHLAINNNININNRPYNIGQLRIRDRFACLLPGSSSNRRSIMGALRAVQI